MFRELVRKNRAISKEKCIALLKNEKRGVLSVVGDEDYPYAMPLNHFYNEEDGCIYFHTGKSGHRTDSLKKHNKVSFCVHDEGYRDEGDWALNISSVIVFGRMELCEDIDTISHITTLLSHKFTNDDEYIKNEIEHYASKTLLLKLNIEHMTGKKIKEA